VGSGAYVSAGEVAAVIGAVALLYTTIDNSIQSHRLNRKLDQNTQVTGEVHSLVNGTNDLLRARVEQLTQVISNSDEVLPPTENHDGERG